MPSAFCRELAIVAVAQQRIVMRIRFQMHTAAVSAVSSRRSAARNVLLSPERHASVPAIPGLHINFRFINKHPNNTPKSPIQGQSRPNGPSVRFHVIRRPRFFCGRSLPAAPRELNRSTAWSSCTAATPARLSIKTRCYPASLEKDNISGFSGTRFPRTEAWSGCSASSNGASPPNLSSS